MGFRMDKTLRFWVECEYESKKSEDTNLPKAELIAEILRDYERHGDAMRYFNVKGQIAWKASPAMLHKLADAEREVGDDLEVRLDDVEPPEGDPRRPGRPRRRPG